ncbi:hypothetical protein NZD89_10950 [Alicyclobacillus fastidiosus]|uniref:Uncharacterized protein n=1 Tax=Alicyclobacillus fastidiosus TaxID=392011 RepID=A0ABY6ZPK1_9BACL|nr:hypothetical protein [Alicyclobacillus fastidiosus]WAH43850.1 hypothetical protein NZD89_10950 [Alicyclobacillus fastidiosus]GMA60088.1 hypothetical protein GCM10025859_05280 [Alicyclobacillus fastidiosus]
MLIYKMATQMRKLQAQGLSAEEAANKLGVKTQLSGIGSGIRSKAAKKK